jgi:hypothetical protein
LTLNFSDQFRNLAKTKA